MDTQWQCKILKIERSRGRVLITLRYSNPSDVNLTFDEQHALTGDPGPNWLSNEAFKRIELLEKADVWSSGLTVDQEIIPVSPVSEITDEALFIQKKLELENAQKLVDLGVLTKEQANIDGLVIEAKSAYNLTK